MVCMNSKVSDQTAWMGLLVRIFAIHIMSKALVSVLPIICSVLQNILLLKLNTNTVSILLNARVLHSQKVGGGLRWLKSSKSVATYIFLIITIEINGNTFR